jgi:hypothetical protein
LYDSGPEQGAYFHSSRVYGLKESGTRAYGAGTGKYATGSVQRERVSVLQPREETAEGRLVGPDGILAEPEASRAQACSWSRSSDRGLSINYNVLNIIKKQRDTGCLLLISISPKVNFLVKFFKKRL